MPCRLSPLPDVLLTPQTDRHKLFFEELYSVEDFAIAADGMHEEEGDAVLSG